MESKNSFEKIMNIDCCDDIKDIVKEWETVSSNLKTVGGGVNINLPVLLWYTKSGVGITYLIGLICEFLEEKRNLIKFSGEADFFEFSLDYCAHPERFNSFTRLIDTLHDFAGFRNEFSGVIRIDIDEWKEKFTEDYFIDFTEFICEISKKNLVILTVTEDKEDSKGLEAFLSASMRLKTAEFTNPTTESYIIYLKDFLMKNNISVTLAAQNILSESIDKLKVSKYFDGYKTVKNMALDIIYDKFSQNPFNAILDEQSVEDFSPQSDYINRTLAGSKRTKNIGFN